MSFWEKHKHQIYKYGHIYATLCGLVVINYIPTQKTNTFRYRSAVVYSHIVSILLIVVMPIYFGYNFSALVASADGRWQLHLVVIFANTLIKYMTVVVTYIANRAHYNAIRGVTKKRQLLEDVFTQTYFGSEQPRRQFETMLLFKFGLINAMLIVQVVNLLYQHFTGAHHIRVHVTAYTFVLWNYTENMADYFYFIISSALKFYQQLNQQLHEIVVEAKHLHGLHICFRRRGKAMQQLLQLCDRLDTLSFRHQQIHKLYIDSVKMHQFQILGLVLTTLINNLTNFFTLFNLFGKNSFDESTPSIAMSTFYAFVFYVDTYIVVQVSENIGREQHNIGKTMREFSGLPQMDERLDQTIEHFTLQVLHRQVGLRICGLFNMDQSLTYLTTATGLTYFITLVQFDMNLE